MPPRLPLQETIEEGLRLLNAPPASDPALPELIVSIGAPKLHSLGYVPARIIPHPEKRLYELLCRKYPERSVHSLYNSWIRRLTSFERAASCVNAQTSSKFAA